MTGDSEHKIVACPEITDGELHHFVNCRGMPCSAIYINGVEKYHAPRDKEKEMIAAYHWRQKIFEEAGNAPFICLKVDELKHSLYINEPGFDSRHESLNITEGEWFLQNSKGTENDWRISQYDACPETSYYMQVKSPNDIVRWLGHLDEKGWVDMVKVFEAVMPAIRWFYDHPEGVKKCSIK